MVTFFLDLFSNPIITGVLGVLIGTLLGHKHALERDKRKEYNAVIDPILLALLKHKDGLQVEIIDQSLNNVTIDCTRLFLSNNQYSKLENSFESYWETYIQGVKKEPLSGLVTYQPGIYEKLNSHITCMLSILKRK